MPYFSKYYCFSYSPHKDIQKIVNESITYASRNLAFTINFALEFRCYYFVQLDYFGHLGSMNQNYQYVLTPHLFCSLLM